MRFARLVQSMASLAAVVVLLGTMAGASPAMAQGTVTGRVTAEGTSEPLGDARLIVIGAPATATTSADGRYTLNGVRVGQVDIQVIHVGYSSVKKTVTVAAGQTATLDFVMSTLVIKLQDVVTTATGQQRKVELGNAIATLGDVTTRVEQTTTDNVSDLLVAKTPGVQLLPGSVLGAAPTVRVRGLSSISLNNAPIWIVDGVRYNVGNSGTSSGQTNITLLNNLSPEEIEDVEIVRGPSAATLYGTAAANGVIVITTKQGHAGNTKWTYTGEARTVDDRNAYQTQFANFGHTPAHPTSEIRCLLPVMQTKAFTTANGATCVSDSITTYNMLEDPSNTIIHLGRGSLYGVNVSGGNSAVRFYSSFDLDNEFGPIQMRQQDINWYQDSLHVPVTNQMMHPRQQQKLNLRTNLSAALSPKFDLNVNAGYGVSDNIIEPDNSLIIGMLYTEQAGFGWKGCPPAMKNTGCGMTGGDGKAYYDPTGFPLYDANSFAPGSIAQYITTDDTQRFTGSTNATWRPLSWWQNDGTVGIDLAMNDNFHVCELNQCPNSGATARVGNVSDSRNTSRNFSTKFTSTGSWQARSWANLKTSVGADYTNTETENTSATGRVLAIGASSLGATTTAISWGAQQPTAVKTLGYYGQEQLALREKLFITVAARQDQNSAFGSKFQNITYPKVSGSWLLSDESFFPKQLSFLNTFRLRSAYGASGVQPGATQALQTFQANTVDIVTKNTDVGTPVAGLVANNPGNSLLKPERSAELESGFDMDLLSRRLHLEYTHYNKVTHDALINVPIASEAAAPVTSLIENVGSTENWGNELQMNLSLVDRRNFGWDMTVSASHNDSKVLNLGIDPTTGLERIIGAGTVTQERVGAPIFSQWYRNYHYSDANGDGVLQISEVTVDSALTNHGVGYAKDLVSIQQGFDFFQRKLHINALFDYKGGGSTLEGNYFQCSSTPKGCQEDNDPTTPLPLQAREVAVVYGTTIGGTNYKSRLGYFVNNQFWKFRELSAVISLPSRIARMARAADGSTLVLGLRNIHTWAPKFTGVDPEQNYGVSGSDVQNDFNTSPPPTYITMRLNLKY